MEINKIYNESCEETLKRMLDNSIDLVITSPPYNMRNRVRNNQYMIREKNNVISNKYNYFSDDLPIDEFYNFHKKTLFELLRVSKIICYNFQIVSGSKEVFFKMIGDFSSYIKDIIIWDKGYGEPAIHEKILNSAYEFILILENDNMKGRLINNSYFKRGTMNNLLRINREKSNVKFHTARFSEKLISILLKSFSKENDLVYDPFMGSGTTAKVCIENKRNYVGSELIKEYCDMAEKNIQSINYNWVF
jgi:site-specific DNA-methyltransferase (adenine-specific)/modification methylase